MTRRACLRATRIAAAAALAAACAKAPASPPPSTADPASLRTPPAGPVVGFRGTYGSHVWLGIPYAKPPVGELRWRAPQPLPAWQSPREALAFGSSCPQFASAVGGDTSKPPGTPVGSEDCLFLNVYAPAFEGGRVPQGGDRLPVMFWVHGGGNTIGSAAFYDGGNLAASEKVVVVTLNYRLGPFGWFHHAALGEGASPAEQSGDFALLDLVRGLEWVRANIAAFGGDPDDVTVFGESAGGQNTVQLLLTPLARGLFQRAIVQSGGTWTSTVAEAEHYADDPEPGHKNSSREVAVRLLARGATGDEARHQIDALPAAEIAQRLRALPALDVLGAYNPGHIGMIDMPRAIRDGVVLPTEDFALRFAAGAVAPVPIVFGTNRDENKLFLFLDPRYVHRWFGVFPQVYDRERFLLTAEYQARSWKASGADELAMALTAAGRDNVYVYRFDWREEPKILWADLGVLLGAAHGFEIPFVFGHWNLGREGRFLYSDASLPGRQELSRKVMSYWTEFARSGAPGRGRGGDLPLWSAWSPRPDGEKFIVLDTESGGGVHMARDAVTNDALIASLRSDPRLADAKLRCAVLASVVAWSSRLDEKDYAAGGCDGFPMVASGE
jgi:para-nitrobenzyl esterase